MKIQETVNMNGKFVQIIREATAEEIEEMKPTPQEEIESLKQELSETDYKAIKYAEGWYSEEEYAPIKAQRQAKRERIGELEAGNE